MLLLSRHHLRLPSAILSSDFVVAQCVPPPSFSSPLICPALFASLRSIGRVPFISCMRPFCVLPCSRSLCAAHASACCHLLLLCCFTFPCLIHLRSCMLCVLFLCVVLVHCSPPFGLLWRMLVLHLFVHNADASPDFLPGTISRLRHDGFHGSQVWTAVSRGQAKGYALCYCSGRTAKGMCFPDNTAGLTLGNPGTGFVGGSKH